MHFEDIPAELVGRIPIELWRRIRMYMASWFLERALVVPTEAYNHEKDIVEIYEGVVKYIIKSGDHMWMVGTVTDDDNAGRAHYLAFLQRDGVRLNGRDVRAW